ncbi:MAG: hypothetical protein FJX72_21045 [Armatimonadetes bacterium]|nr:hypothetical protein [Armatimonadota bacterium]
MDTRDRLLARLLDAARRSRGHAPAPPEPDGWDSPLEHLTDRVLAALSRARAARARRGHTMRLAAAGACTLLACLVAVRVADRGPSAGGRDLPSIRPGAVTDTIAYAPPSAPPDPAFAAWLHVLDTASRR